MKKKRPSNKVIIIPVDFTTIAESAMDHGIEIARCVNASVCLLHVFDPSVSTILNKEDPGWLKAAHGLAEYKERYEDEFEVTIETLLRPGNLFKVINRVAREINPWLMVLGTHGKQGLQHLFGSHALRVVLDVTCPVLVVQERRFKEGYRRIVVPVNRDTDPAMVTEWILQLGNHGGTESHLVQVKGLNPELKETNRSIVSNITRKLKGENAGFVLATAGSIEDFSQQVLEYAGTCNADLIVTMTTPAATATGYMLSDWNERLMFNPLQIPVLFVDRTDNRE